MYVYVTNTIKEYSVTYNSNGGNGTMLDNSSPYKYGSQVNILANTFTRSNFRFTGWNTAADGSGTSYTAGNEFTMPASDVTLYARWAVIDNNVNYKVYYNANTGEASVEDPDNTYDYQDTVTVSTNEFIRSNYRFTGWNTAADGSGTSYAAGNEFAMPAHDVTLYAQWTANDYKVYYNANIGGASIEDPNNPYSFEDTVTVLTNEFTRLDYSFKEWNTEADDSGISYAVGNEFTMPAHDVTLYAQWSYIGDDDDDDDDDDDGGSGGGGGGGGGTPTIIEDPEVPLADLEKIDHFAYAIGYPDGEVKPLNNITREEVAMIFYRLLTDESRDEWLSDVNPFTDLEGHDWSNRAISTLYNAGIIKGYPDGTFGPSDPISRAEFATIAAKFDNLELENTSKFTDISGHWAEKYITSSEIKGWIKGYPDNTFKPEQDITRAEAMTLINNVLERKVPEENIHPDAMFWPDIVSDDWYYEAVMEATNSHDYIYEEDGDELWTGMKLNKVWP